MSLATPSLHSSLLLAVILLILSINHMEMALRELGARKEQQSPWSPPKEWLPLKAHTVTVIGVICALMACTALQVTNQSLHKHPLIISVVPLMMINAFSSCRMWMRCIIAQQSYYLTPLFVSRSAKSLKPGCTSTAGCRVYNPLLQVFNCRKCRVH